MKRLDPHLVPPVLVALLVLGVVFVLVGLLLHEGTPSCPEGQTYELGPVSILQVGNPPVTVPIYPYAGCVEVAR